MPGMRGAFGCFTLLSLLFAGHPAIARVLRETPSGFVATRVLDGDEFVEAVTQFGREGGQVELQLDTAAAISLANSTWSVKAQYQGFKGGTLLIKPAPSQDGSLPGLAVLDTAMKSGLAPYGAKYEATWQGIVFINLCTNAWVWDSANGVSVYGSSSVYLMPRPRLEPLVNRSDSIFYVPYNEFSNVVYFSSLDLSPFRKIFQERWSSQFLKFHPETGVQVEHMDEFSLTMRFARLGGGTDKNVTYRVTSNPNDPFGLKLPQFGGSLMPHELCAQDGNSSGLFMGDELALSPNPATWVVGSSAQLRDALRGISDHGFMNNSARKELEPIAMAIIVKDVSVADGGAAALSGIPFAEDVLLHGPLHNLRPTLDFSGAKGVLSLGRQMTLFIRNLVLTGLASSAVLSGDGLSIQNSTSLQLSAINRSSSVPCYLHGVTLQVAKSDFLALLSAATRGPQWKSGASATLPLLEPISVFKPKAYNSSMIELDEYSGWGLTGNEILFIPDSPIQESDTLLDEANSGGSGESKVALGVGVGVGVGGGLLLITLLAWLAVVRTRRNRGIGSSLAVVSSEVPSSVGSKEEKDTKTGIKHSKEAAFEGKQSEEGSIALEFTDQSGSSSTILPQTQATGAPSKQFRRIEMSRGSPSNDSASGMYGPGIPVKVQLDAQSVPLVVAEQKEEEFVEAPDPRKVPGTNPHELVQKEIAGLVNLSSDDVLRLQSVLGKGAWGTVYKGTWKGLTVAVKTVLFTERTGGDGELPQKARAILEAAVSTSMSHENIVSTYHYDIKPVRDNVSAEQPGLQVASMTGVVDDWKLYLVLEYCQCSLGVAMNLGLFHRDSQLDLDTGLHLLIDVARGTQYLHEHFIIHGDLKPDNILLKTDSRPAVGFVAKITDFGLAINLGPTATHVSNFTSGTPFYCAPEVVLNGRTTKASDAFSFGVVMAELCSKTPPWLKMHNGDYVANPSFPFFPSGTPRALVDLTMRCLDQDLLQRPKFDEIVNELQGILDVYKGIKGR